MMIRQSTFTASLVLIFLLAQDVLSFAIVRHGTSRLPRREEDRIIGARRTPLSLVLFMGRAAAVRAATKAKTDAKKAKTNALFGKKIIVAVKEGGSPDPNANRQLADIIKQAKANSVPVDNINRAIKKASEANAGDFK